MNKAFILHYVEDNSMFYMLSKDVSTLIDKITEFHEQDLVTDHDYIETVFYDEIEELFQYINKLNTTQ